MADTAGRQMGLPLYAKGENNEYNEFIKCSSWSSGTGPDLGHHGHWCLYHISYTGFCGSDRRRFFMYRRCSLHYDDVKRTECMGGHVCSTPCRNGGRLRHRTFTYFPAILSGILTQLGLYSINLKIMGKANQAINVDKYSLLVSLRFIRNVPLFKNTILLVSLIIVVLIVILYWFFGTELGCSIRATGCNDKMARAQGINTDFNRVLGLMISNGMVALSGALLSQYQGFADINMGRGAIVIGLAAVIIGEAIFGKIFRNFGLRLLSVAFGSIIYYLVLQIVIWLGIDTDLLKLLSAAVVAIFLAIPTWKARYFSMGSKGGKA